MLLKMLRQQHSEFREQLELGCEELKEVNLKLYSVCNFVSQLRFVFRVNLQHFQRNSKLAESSKRLKSQIWSSVVTILLVKAKDLPLAEDGSKLIDIHFKFR